MPAMQFPKILALIEGSMEKLFVNSNFHYVEVVTLTNGSGWTVEALCNQIGTKYYTKNMNADRIIVWLDKEKQNCSVEEIRSRVIDELVSRGATRERIFVCVPDQMTENIILADEEVIRSEFEEEDYSYQYEGQNGKSILSGKYADRGKNYKETFHGVLLLKKIRLERAARKSESARLFLDGLGLPCWWIQC